MRRIPNCSNRRRSRDWWRISDCCSILMVWRAHAPAWHVESSGRKLANLEYSQASRRVSTRHARVRALRLLDAFYDAGAEIVVDRSNATNLESGDAVQIVPLSFSSFTARDKSSMRISKSFADVFSVLPIGGRTESTQITRPSPRMLWRQFWRSRMHFSSSQS